MLSMADFRAARQGFRATAITFAAIGLLLGVMTTWPLPIRMLVCAAFFSVAGAGLIWVLDYLKVREALGIETKTTVTPHVEAHPLVLQAQFEKIKKVESFFGGKDEMGLRNIFDLPNILTKNIGTQNIRINFIRLGKEKEFFYNNYSDNGSFIFLAKEGHFTTGPSGVHVEAGPKDVLFLVTTEKFQAGKKQLIEFMNSALIPQNIKVELSAFDEVLNQDTQLMIHVMDERMHQDENYFIHNMDMGTSFYGVIVTDYARRIIPLKPVADRVLSAITSIWKINE